MLAELLDTVDAEKKGSARETLRDDIAASLACHAAIKVNMSLTPEKMRWLIDRLLKNLFANNVSPRTSGYPASRYPRHTQRVPSNLANSQQIN